MRIVKIVLFFALVFLSANTISAQYGNSNGYGGSNNGYGNGYGGSNRSNQMGQSGQDAQMSAPKPVPAEKTAAKIVEYYKKELTLDALQELVITNVFTKSLKKQEVLEKQEISDDEKLKEFTVLSEMTDLQVMQILNKEQKEKYHFLSEERKSKIESRKH